MKFALVVAAASAVSFAAQAQETEIPLSEVPETVMDAAHDAAEGVTFKSVATEDDGGETKYGFVGTRADGSEVDVDVLETGEVIEVEFILTMDAVPEDVKALLDRFVPGLKPEEVERAVQDDRQVVYEFEGTDGSGAPVDIDIPWDAQEITIDISGS